MQQPPPPAGGYGQPAWGPPGPPPPPGQPHYLPPPPPAPQNASGCLTTLLVGAAIAVPLIAILAVLAVYGVRKYIVNAKTLEARVALVQMGRLASEAYGREGHLCSSATASVPADPAAIRGHFYQSQMTEWNADAEQKGGFACLGFAMVNPQYFQYAYSSVPGTSFAIVAHGDLDGDGVLSTFELDGKLVERSVVVGTTIKDINPEE